MNVYVKTILKSLDWTHIDGTPWIWKQKKEYLISHPNWEQKQNPGPVENNQRREAKKPKKWVINGNLGLKAAKSMNNVELAEKEFL